MWREGRCLSATTTTTASGQDVHRVHFNLSTGQHRRKCARAPQRNMSTRAHKLYKDRKAHRRGDWYYNVLRARGTVTRARPRQQGGISQQQQQQQQRLIVMWRAPSILIFPLNAPHSSSKSLQADERSEWERERREEKIRKVSLYSRSVFGLTKRHWFYPAQAKETGVLLLTLHCLLIYFATGGKFFSIDHVYKVTWYSQSSILHYSWAHCDCIVYTCTLARWASWLGCIL